MGVTHCDDCVPVFLLEFPELASIDDASDDIPHIESLSYICSYDTM